MLLSDSNIYNLSQREFPFPSGWDSIKLWQINNMTSNALAFIVPKLVFFLFFFFCNLKLLSVKEKNSYINNIWEITPAMLPFSFSLLLSTTGSFLFFCKVLHIMTPRIHIKSSEEERWMINWKRKHQCGTAVCTRYFLIKCL